VKAEKDGDAVADAVVEAVVVSVLGPFAADPVRLETGAGMETATVALCVVDAEVVVALEVTDWLGPALVSAGAKVLGPLV
jgi:hypothetical protein